MNYRQWDKIAYPATKHEDDDDGLGHSTAPQPAENDSLVSSASDGPQRVIVVGGEAYLHKPEVGPARYSSDYALKKFEAQHKFMTVASSPEKLSLNAQRGKCEGSLSPSNGTQQIVYIDGELYLYELNQVADHSPESGPTRAPTSVSYAPYDVTRGDAISGPNTGAFNSNSRFSVGTPLAIRLMRAAADILNGCNVKAATGDDVDKSLFLEGIDRETRERCGG